MMTQKLLDLAGIGRERLHLAWISSAEAQRFTEVAYAVTDSIKKQGRFNINAFQMELAAARMTVESATLRWLTGKEVSMTTKGDVYGRKWDVEEYQATIYSILEREFQKNLICLAIKEGCVTVRDISNKIGMDLLQVSYLLADLEHTGKVEFTGMEGHKPIFAAL